MHDAGEIERAVASFASAANGGLIVTGSATNVHRDLIIALAARHRLPAVYTNRAYVAEGGLIAYGPDRVDQYRRAAEYVDSHPQGREAGQICRCRRRPDSSWRSTSRRRRRSGLTVPPSILARADEVIE